jgi:hypothetical protein
MPPSKPPSKVKKQKAKARGRTKGASIAQSMQAHRAVLRAITKSTIVKNNISLSSGAGGYAPIPMGFNYSLPQPVEHPVYGLPPPRALDVKKESKGTTMNDDVKKDPRPVVVKKEPKSTRSQGVQSGPATSNQATQRSRAPLSMSGPFTVASLDPDAPDRSDARPPQNQRTRVHVKREAENQLNTPRAAPATRPAVVFTAMPLQASHPLRRIHGIAGPEARRAYRYDLNHVLMYRNRQMRD